MNNEIPSGIITGASSGTGWATALAFSKLGANLVVAARRKDRLNQLVDEVKKLGGNAVAVPADVSQPKEVEQMVGQALKNFGRIDFVMANAGLGDMSLVADGDPARWKQLIDTNVLGTIYTVRYSLPSMIARKKGHIFITSSVCGRVSAPYWAVYNASKWAVIGFGDTVRKEVCNQGIRVTLVEPGFVDSEFNAAAGATGQAVDDFIASISPILKPEDVANTIVHAYQQPPHVSINEILIRPTKQES